MNIGKRIRDRRKELGLSADDLAEAIGKDRTTIYRYERGAIEKLPTNILVPIAEALHTTPAYLMGWDDDPMDYEEWLNDECHKIPDDIWPEITDPQERAKKYYEFKKAEEEDHYLESVQPLTTQQKVMRIIQRGSANFDEHDYEKMLKVLNATFDDAFEDDGSDGL